uniref:Scaffolding anchor of CK1 domain-containing protein n=1 Tax=Denticeps clupeoides TaxID=299321 RepID=A0AAY4DSM5_9TELE
MADSQLLCMDDGHVNEKIPESKPEFYYSEEQRAALEQLLRNGDGAFKTRLREDNVKDFLSAREVRWVRKSFQEYDAESDPESCDSASPPDSNRDSGVHSTYWPERSDAEVPSLDIGWPGGGFYRGVTRVSVYTHPPKEKSPHVKEVVRRLIQESSKVVAVVMDHLTDLQILQDLLDAGTRRGVAVYILLEAQGLPHFLDMMNRLQITALHLRNLRVRSVHGPGLALSFGKLSGPLCSKYMLVDGEKVMFGSYSFTWCSSRVERNMITVMTGQVVDFYDSDFRELYAMSREVDLYREFNINKPAGVPLPMCKAEAPNVLPPVPITTSRFQVSIGDHKQVNLKVPVHKYHNPKYSLVVGNNLGLTGSLQDLSSIRDSVEVNTSSVKALQKKALNGNKGSSEQLDKVTSQSPALPGPAEEDKFLSFGTNRQRSSFRVFLKNKMANQSIDTQMDNMRKDSSSEGQNCPQPSIQAKIAIFSQDAAANGDDKNRRISPMREDPRASADMRRYGTEGKTSARMDNFGKDSKSAIFHSDSKHTKADILNEASQSTTANTLKDAKMSNCVPQAKTNGMENKGVDAATCRERDTSDSGALNSALGPVAVNHNTNANPVTMASHRTETQPVNTGPSAGLTDARRKETPPPVNTDCKRAGPGKDTGPSAGLASPGVPDGNCADDLEDTFVVIENPSLLKLKSRSPSKLNQRSVSLQTLNATGEQGELRNYGEVSGN